MKARLCATTFSIFPLLLFRTFLILSNSSISLLDSFALPTSFSLVLFPASTMAISVSLFKTSPALEKEVVFTPFFFPQPNARHLQHSISPLLSVDSVLSGKFKLLPLLPVAMANFKSGLGNIASLSPPPKHSLKVKCSKSANSWLHKGYSLIRTMLCLPFF